MTIKLTGESDLENFHRSKLLSKESLHGRIQKQIQLQADPQPVLVPNGLQINSVLYVPKPLRCSLVTSSPTHDCYVAHYGAGPENGINIWSKGVNETKINKQKKKLDCRITNIIFIPSNYIYFASCDDLTLRIFSNKFREYCQYSLQYSILSMIYDENRSNVITGCVGAIQQWKLQTCLHKPPILLRETKLEDHITGVTPWISFLHLSTENNVVLALTGTAIFLLDAESLEQVSFIENRHTFPLTTCYTYLPRHYLITGAKNGDIVAWNMSMYSFPYVGTFSGHMKKIIKILTHPVEPLLITASEDFTIRFWRIETFQETYRFDVLDSLIDINIVNSWKLYYTSTKSISLLDFHYFHSIFSLIGTTISSIERIEPLNKPARLMIVGDDDGVRIVSPTHGNILTMVFPIVTHKSVVYLHDSIEEVVYILLKDGGVMVMSTKSNPCRTIEFWRAPKFDDKVKCLGLIFLEIGNESRSLLFGTHFDGRISLLRGKGLTMKPISSSRGMITKFEQNSVRNSLCQFLTYNTENVVTLWKIKMLSDIEIKLVALDEIQLEMKPNHLTLHGETVGIAGGKKFMLIRFTPRKRGNFLIECKGHEKDERHRATISHVKSCSYLPIIATASVDGRVKIWSLECGLLRELAFDHTLSGLCFANDRGDLLVGFQKNLHFVSVLEFLPVQYLQRLLTDDYHDDTTEYCITFDPLLHFWFNPRWVPTISILRSNSDSSDTAAVSNEIQEAPADISEEDIEARDSEGELFGDKTHPYLAEGEKLDFYKAALLLIRTDDMQTNSAKGRWKNLKPLHIWALSNSPYKTPPSKHQNRRISLTPLSNSPHTPFLHMSVSEAIANEIINIVNSSPSRESLADIYCSESDNDLQIQNEATPATRVNTTMSDSLIETKKFWPCAPDGFIPNSIIRHLINPVPPKSAEAVKPYQPRRLSKLTKDQPVFEDIFDDEFDQIRTWCSDEEEAVDEEDLGDFDWDDFSFSSGRKDSSKKSSKKKESNKKNSEETQEERKTKREGKLKGPYKQIQKLIPKKKIRFEKKTIPEAKEEEEELTTETKNESETITKQIIDKSPEPELVHNTDSDIIPAPYDKYYKQKWFPTEVGFNAGHIVMAILEKIDPLKPLELKEMFQCIVDIHKTLNIPSDVFNELIQKLLQLLDNPSGQVRHYVVKTLLGLGENRKSVILQLVPKLADPVLAVREEVKSALKEMAGINSADTLIAKLIEYGELREVKLANDREVLDSLRETLIQRREAFMERIAKLAETYNKTTSLTMGWLTKARISSQQRKRGELATNSPIINQIVNEEMTKQKSLEDQTQLVQKESQLESTMSECTDNDDDNDDEDDEDEIINKELSFLCTSPFESFDRFREDYYHGDKPCQVEVEVKLDKVSAVNHHVKAQDCESSGPDLLTPTIPDKNQLLLPTKQKKGNSKKYSKKKTSTLLLNKKILCENGEGNIDEIQKIAPRIYKRFSLLNQNCPLLQSFKKYSKSSPMVYKESEDDNDDEGTHVPVKTFHMKLQRLTTTVPSLEEVDVDENVEIEPERRKQLIEMSKHVISLQKTVLATAISALRAKRLNGHYLGNYGIISNEMIRDINELMVLFRNKEKFDLDMVNTISEIVTDLQNEVKKANDALPPSVLKPTVKNFPKVTRMDLVPSPVRKEMVPGVCGERILSRLQISPKNLKSKERRYRVMKPIPERHGNFTVTQCKGRTNYGSIQFHWTTLTSGYDMNVTCGDINNHSYRRRAPFLPQVTKDLLHLHTDRGNLGNTFYNKTPLVDNISFGNAIYDKSTLSYGTKRRTRLALPSIKSSSQLDRGSGVQSVTTYNVPAPPNTALAFSR